MWVVLGRCRQKMSQKGGHIKRGGRLFLAESWGKVRPGWDGLGLGAPLKAFGRRPARWPAGGEGPPPGPECAVAKDSGFRLPRAARGTGKPSSAHRPAIKGTIFISFSANLRENRSGRRTERHLHSSFRAAFAGPRGPRGVQRAFFSIAGRHPDNRYNQIKLAVIRCGGRGPRMAHPCRGGNQGDSHRISTGSFPDQKNNISRFSNTKGCPNGGRPPPSRFGGIRNGQLAGGHREKPNCNHTSEACRPVAGTTGSTDQGKPSPPKKKGNQPAGKVGGASRIKGEKVEAELDRHGIVRKLKA